MGRLSGPLLDRIDLHVDVPALSYERIADKETSGPTSEEVRGKVQAARDIQGRRYDSAFTCNAHIDSAATRKHCVLEDGADKLLRTAIDQLGFSARAYDKVLRVARTLADLEEADTIASSHVAEAIQYRGLDRQLFYAERDEIELDAVCRPTVAVPTPTGPTTSRGNRYWCIRRAKKAMRRWTGVRG